VMYEEINIMVVDATPLAHSLRSDPLSCIIVMWCPMLEGFVR